MRSRYLCYKLDDSSLIATKSADLHKLQKLKPHDVDPTVLNPQLPHAGVTTAWERFLPDPYPACKFKRTLQTFRNSRYLMTSLDSIFPMPQMSFLCFLFWEKCSSFGGCLFLICHFMLCATWLPPCGDIATWLQHAGSCRVSLWSLYTSSL